MALSISENITDCRFQPEESLSQSQLLLSQSLRSFCQEASSCSAVFALAAGQWVGLLAKFQSFKFLSLFCRTDSSRFPIHTLSAAFGIIVEGISFPLATQLGKSEELQIGNLGSNFHGILTLALCKTIGKKFPINNLVFQHAVQDCAMVAFDLSCEKLGIIERKNFGTVERILEAEIACIRIETSAKLLATSCPGFSILQSKRELNCKFRVRSSTLCSSKEFFIPKLAASNGWIMNSSVIEGISQPLFSVQTKDVGIIKTTDRQVRANLRKESRSSSKPVDEKINSLELEKRDYFELLPKTSRERLKIVEKESATLSVLIKEIWNTLCADPRYLQNISDRGGLIDKFQEIGKVSLRRKSRYSEEKIGEIIDFGITLLFKKIGENELFHVEESNRDLVNEEDLCLEEREKIIPEKRYKPLRKGASHGEKKRKSLDEKEILPLYEDFQRLERENPALARSVVIAVTVWGSELERMQKEDRSGRFADTLKDPELVFDLFEVSARKILRAHTDLSLDAIYTEVLPVAFQFRHLHEEISNSHFGVGIAHRYFSKPLEIGLFYQAGQGIYSHQRSSLRMATDPSIWIEIETPLSILMKSIQDSGKSMIELKRLMKVDLDRVLKELTAAPEERALISLELILQVKAIFDDLKVTFDTARFYRVLYPSIREVFSEMAGDPPCLIVTESQLQRASFFNLGGRLLAHRLDSQRVEEKLTTEQVAEVLKVSAGTVQRYQTNVIHMVDDQVLMRTIDSLLKLSASDRQVAYFASRPEIVELIPVWIINQEGVKKRLSVEQARKFRQRRALYLNAALLREEVAQALARLELKDEEDFGAYLENRGIASKKAKKIMFIGESLADQETEAAINALGLSYAKWQRHFDLSVDSYFLGIDENGEVLYPTREDFAKLSQLRPCSPSLMKKKYPNAENWESLPLEDQWHLHLLQRAIDKFQTTDAASKKIGIAIIKYNEQFRRSVVNRSWPTETIAQYANMCELSREERALLYMYFRQKSLEKKLLI